MPALDETAMQGRVGEGFEPLDRPPHRHVEQDARIVEGRDLRGVAGLVLEPPDKAVAPLGERIDPVEIVDEVRDAGIVQRIARPADVDLRELHVSSLRASILDASGSHSNSTITASTARISPGLAWIVFTTSSRTARHT